MQPLYSNAVEGCVVQHHNSICIQGEALQGEQGVVGLHHHIAGLILVGKHTADRVMNALSGVQGQCTIQFNSITFLVFRTHRGSQ